MNSRQRRRLNSSCNGKKNTASNLARYTSTCIMAVTLKRVRWMGSSYNDLRKFPREAMRRTGYELERVQRAQLPRDWKPMTAVGKGVCEIRVHTATEHRLIYIATFAEAVYVLHVFEKRTQKT